MTPWPAWEAIPEPPPIDKARLNEFAVLAAEDLPAVEAAAEQVAADVHEIATRADAAELASDLLGLDLAAGFEELAAMRADAAGDTLESELAAAADQDAAIAAVAAELATSLGEPPPPAEVPTPTPSPDEGVIPEEPPTPPPEGEWPAYPWPPPYPRPPEPEWPYYPS